MPSLPCLLGCLLVRVRPVEDLLLDELPGGDGPERRARKVEVGPGAQRHQSFVVHLPGLQLSGVVRILCEDLAHFLGPAQRRVFPVVEVPGVPAPRTVVVLVQDYAVPPDRLDPFVSGLYASGCIPSQDILKGGEAHESPALIDTVELPVILLLAELPTSEVLVGQQVLLPGGLDGRLECEDKDFRPAHPECKLVSGECLAEAHLGVPEEVRGQSLVGRVFPERTEIECCFLNGPFLFRTHLEVLGPVNNPVIPRHGGCDGLLDRSHITDAPFPFWIRNMPVPEYVADKVVIEPGPVLAHGRALQDNPVPHMACLVLFPRADLRRARGVAHLEPPLVGRIVNMLIGIDGRGRCDPATE